MNPDLTKRQLEVLKLTALGYSQKETGGELGIHPKTVEKHKQQIYYKLEVNDELAMVRVALRKKMITLKEFLASPVGENAAHEVPRA